MATPDDTTATEPRRARAGQKGVALIAVACALAILGVAVGEFSTDATIDAQAAANARDDMQTEFLVRSGANLAQLIIRLQTDLVDKRRGQMAQIGLGDFQIADYAGMFMGAFGGGHDEVDAMAQMLGGFRGDAIKGLGVAVGTFDVQKVKFEYYDWRAKDWKDDWDSTQADGERGRLPERVRITIEIENGEGTGTMKYTTTARPMLQEQLNFFN